MKRKINIFFVIALNCLIYASCSSQIEENSLKLSVKIIKLDLWINLMPGGPKTFHVAGEVKLLNDESHELNNLQMTNILVLQNDKELYSFNPSFYLKDESGSIDLKSKEEKTFLFSTKAGLLMNKELDLDSVINVIITIRDKDGKSLRYEIEKVKIKKAY